LSENITDMSCWSVGQVFLRHNNYWNYRRINDIPVPYILYLYIISSFLLLFLTSITFVTAIVSLTFVSQFCT